MQMMMTMKKMMKMMNIAIEELKDIETDFAKLKDKLYNTQQTKLEFELKLCEANKHPDLLRYIDLIKENFENKVERCVNLQKYKLQCLDKQTKARRVAANQQFLKNCQDYKTKEIVSITSNWYEINKERRNMDSLILNNPEYFQYNLSINSKNVASQDKINNMVVMRNSLYNELSNMKRITKVAHGLVPSSLNNMKSCTNEEINDDLKAMGILK
ncbi:unnamed protein product [Ambrosiozyma monospora]|uniref:Unnamed protein product n=2 Tax=Ambrosiozyma monospora TaxID=43982 RepID=A0ACB5UCD8_AMBMO|nr:unnamed protein product [Ambrosiozyma monospora]